MTRYPLPGNVGANVAHPRSEQCQAINAFSLLQLRNFLTPPLYSFSASVATSRVRFSLERDVH